MARIGVIGTGHIAAPMVRFLVGKGHDLCVTERSQTVSSALAANHGVAVAATQTVVDQSDILLLCLRPHVAADILGELTFAGHHRIVSVMAGVTEESLREICAPVQSFVQTIPLGYLEKGGCPLAAYGDAALLAELFEPENPVFPVKDEAALNAHFAVCAMVPGLLDLMKTGADWLGGETGADAERYTTQLVSGFLAAMDGDLAAERDALATEGTLSLQMTTALQDGGAHAALTGALTAIGERLKS